MVREDRPMSFFEHLEELRARLLRAFLAFVITFVAIFAIHIDFATFRGLPVPVPSFDLTNPLPAQVLTGLIGYLVPSDVTIVVLSPQEFFLQELKVGAFLAIIVAMPFIVYEVSGFIAPGLYANERRLIVRVAAPAAALFLVGILFALFLVLPFTFRFLYSLVPSNYGRFLQVDAFLDLVIPFLVGFGLAFELPIVMAGLSFLGVVDHTFWKQHWRAAVVAAFLFGAFITPDGTGITMTFVAVPMLGLYVAGYAACVVQERGRDAKPS